MTDQHPDLTALSPPPPLEPHERMSAASARFLRMAGLRGLPSGAVTPLHTLGRTLAIAANIHAAGDCEMERDGSGPCLPQQLADLMLGGPA